MEHFSDYPPWGLSGDVIGDEGSSGGRANTLCLFSTPGLSVGCRYPSRLLIPFELWLILAAQRVFRDSVFSIAYSKALAFKAQGGVLQPRAKLIARNRYPIFSFVFLVSPM